MTLARPITTIRQELEQAKTDLMLTEQIPNVSILSARVSRLTAEALIDETKKPQLAEALVNLRNAEDAHDKRSFTKARIPELERELQEAEQAERIARIDEANARLNEALADYRSAARVVAEKHRRILDIARMNHLVPGAATMLPAKFDEFHIPALMPLSWEGTLGQAMRQGPMPWEQQLKAVA